MFPPLKGGGEEDHAIFTYSNSPGLLSMPTLGGAIHEANLPASYCGCIRLSMKTLSASFGRKSLRWHCHSASLICLPSTSAFTLENSPIFRLNATCGSLIWNGMPKLSITLFHRPTPTLASFT